MNNKMIFKRDFNLFVIMNNQFLFRQEVYFPNGSIVKFDPSYFIISEKFIIPDGINAFASYTCIKDYNYCNFLIDCYNVLLKNKRLLNKYKTLFGLLEQKIFTLKKNIQASKLSSYFYHPNENSIFYKHSTFEAFIDQLFKRVEMIDQEHRLFDLSDKIKWSYSSHQINDQGFFTHEAEVIAGLLDDAKTNEQFKNEAQKLKLISNENWISNRTIAAMCENSKEEFFIIIFEQFKRDFDGLLRTFTPKEHNDLLNHIFLKAVK